MYEQTFPDNWEAYRHGGTPEEEIEGTTVLERMSNFLLKEIETSRKNQYDRNQPEFKDLWDYLTALRGPDGIASRGFSIKQSTTAVIRGKLMGFRELTSLAQADMNERDTVCMSCANEEGGHFGGHIERAAMIVGLKLKDCSHHLNKVM